MDWAKWSRDAVALMKQRTRECLERHGLTAETPYRWDLDSAQIRIGEVTLGITVVGTIAADSFLWSWANEAIPAQAKERIDEVHSFGVEHDLGLLVEPCFPGGVSSGKECLAIAGRVLDADGVWVDTTDAGFILFTLHEPRPDLDD